MTTVVACPACQQNLQVPPEQLGQEVRCPGCEHVFTAVDTAVRSAGPPPLPPPLPGGDIPVRDVVVEDVPAWEKPSEDELEKPLEEDEAEKLERRRRKKEEKKARKLDTSKGSIYSDLTRRQGKMLSEHRGPLVLILGILSIVFCGCSLLSIGACACGYYAYQIGSHDLQEMYAGRMDRSGEAIVKVGRILGMVGICLSLPIILLQLGLLVLWFVSLIVAMASGR
jgi:predicted Zn finger-like uncharacterized protein